MKHTSQNLICKQDFDIWIWNSNVMIYSQDDFGFVKNAKISNNQQCLSLLILFIIKILQNKGQYFFLTLYFIKILENR